MKDLLSKLTWVDYIALVALLRGLYVGYKSGLIQELLRILAYVLSLLVTLQLHGWIAEQLTLRTFLNETIAQTVSFTALLVGLLIGLKILRALAVKLLKLEAGGTGQRILGAALGGARLLVLLSFFFMLVDATPLKELKTDVHTRSLTGPMLSQAAPALYGFLENLSPQIGFLNNS